MNNDKGEEQVQATKPQTNKGYNLHEEELLAMDFSNSWSWT
jgi:hypothetical protein